MVYYKLVRERDRSRNDVAARRRRLLCAIALLPVPVVRWQELVSLSCVCEWSA